MGEAAHDRRARGGGVGLKYLSREAGRGPLARAEGGAAPRRHDDGLRKVK